MKKGLRLFRSIIDENVNSPNECWIWTGMLNRPNGYGQIWRDGEFVLAHRLSYRYFNGTFPPQGKIVMHTCDNKKCINPKHLKLGTQKENIHDAISKGRFCGRKKMLK